jgi:type I restriction enzyme S subunit
VGWIDDYIFDEELLLLGEDGAPFLDPGRDKAYIVRGKYWVNNHAHVLRAIRGITSNSYLLHYLNYCDYHNYVTGTTRLKLNQSRLRSIPIKIAPQREQQRIVAKIDELFTQLDAGVATLKHAQANLKQYKASVLKAACEGRLVPNEAELARAEGRDYEPASVLLERILAERKKKWEEEAWEKIVDKSKQKVVKARRKVAGRPLKRGKKLSPEEWQDIPEEEYAKYLPKDDKWKENYQELDPPDIGDLPKLPKSWIWAFLPQLGELNRGKSKHRPRNDPKLYGGAYPFIQTGDVRQVEGYLYEYSQTYNEQGLAQSRLWPAGTLAITIAANIAETAILGLDACFPDSVVGFIPVSSQCNVRFIEYYFRIARENLERYAPATAQKNINLQTLSSLVVPLPPHNEQLRIVEEVEKLLSIVKQQEISIQVGLSRAGHLRQAILRCAFAGNLVIQDPSDESAGNLLERIRSNRKASEKANRKMDESRNGGNEVKLPLFNE